MATRRRRGPLINVLVLAAAIAGLLSLVLLVGLDGLAYYRTPLRTRGYLPQHSLLKPSGIVAHPLGALGVLMLFVPAIYVLRKRWPALANIGSIASWLEVHVFCGIIGPILITFHSAFKFNGIIAVSYWSMMAVMLSGFVGRYLYVRIPKSIRGTELTHDEIQARAADLAKDLEGQGVESALVQPLTHADVLSRSRLRHFRKELMRSGVSRRVSREVTAIAAERSLLLKRLARLNRTKELFAAWHVLHQPLVYVMFIIAAIHVGVAVYFGYS